MNVIEYVFRIQLEKLLNDYKKAKLSSSEMRKDLILKGCDSIVISGKLYIINAHNNRYVFTVTSQSIKLIEVRKHVMAKKNNTL